MPDRSSKDLDVKGKLDTAMSHPETVPVTQTEPEKNPAAVALGRLGGLKGGKARAEKLTPEKRKEIAKKAAAKRWGHEPQAPTDTSSSSSSGA